MLIMYGTVYCRYPPVTPAIMHGTVYCRYPPVTPANVWNCIL